MDAFLDELGSVIGDAVVHALGEVGFGLLEDLVHRFGTGDRVAAGRLVDADDGGGKPVLATQRFHEAGAQFDARHVLQADEGAAFGGADDDVAEFLRRGKATLGLNRKLEGLVGERRR